MLMRLIPVIIVGFILHPGIHALEVVCHETFLSTPW
jgi:hypothetical protein